MSTENRQLHTELQTIYKMASEKHETNANADIELEKKLSVSLFPFIEALNSLCFYYMQ